MTGSAGHDDIRVATLTVSDTRTAADDEGGRTLRSLLAGAGLVLGEHAIVRDDPTEIVRVLERWTGDEQVPAVDVIVTTGGTGIAPRDQTYEAIETLLEKKLDGFGEAFRRLSWDAIGPRAVLSRAVAGVWRGRVLVALPGSPAALSLAVQQILGPVLPHAVALVRGRGRH